MHCPRCHALTPHTRPGTNHGMMLLILVIATMFTGIFGLFAGLILWAFATWSDRSRERCEQCGRQRGAFG